MCSYLPFLFPPADVLTTFSSLGSVIGTVGCKLSKEVSLGARKFPVNENNDEMPGEAAVGLCEEVWWAELGERE